MTTQPGSDGPSDDIVTGHGERGEGEATGPGGDDEANEEGTAEAREEGSQQRATGGERQETRAGAAMKHVVEGIRARFGRPGAGEGSPGQPTASPSPRVTDRPAASPRFGGVFTPLASNANAQGLGDDDDPGLRSFVDDFHSRVWITYRRGFPHIGGSTYTTDAGWGCTLRSGQMLLANSLQTHFFGRQWRWEPPPPRSSVAALTDGTGTPASTDGTATGFGAGVGAGAAAGVASLLQRWDSGWNGAGRDGREGVTEVPLRWIGERGKLRCHPRDVIDGRFQDAAGPHISRGCRARPSAGVVRRPPRPGLVPVFNTLHRGRLGRG